MAFQAQDAKTISWFYAAAFGRTPVPDSTAPDNGDLGGLIFWTDAFLAGEGDLAQYNGNLDAIGNFFVASPEFQSRFPDTLTNEQFVTALYNNMLNRAPDLQGFDFWVGQLNSGESRGAVLVDFANTPENQGAIPDQSEALDSFILFIANDNSMPNPVIEPGEADTWLAANPEFDASVIDAVQDTTPPVVEAGQTETYSEDSAAGATLFTVEAADNEGGSGIASFEIVSGNDDEYFQIDADGDISLTAAGAAAGVASNSSTVDPDTFTLGVTATDRAGNTSTAVDVALTVADITPPEFDAASLNAASELVINYDEPLNRGSVPAGSSFTILQNGNTTVTVSSVRIDGSTVVLKLATAPTGSLTVAYDPPAVSPLQDLAGNDAAAFSAQRVTVDTTPPAITAFDPADGATSVPTGADLVLTFDESVFLSNGSIVLTNPNATTDTRTITIENGAVKAGSDGTVTISGNTVTIDLTDTLLANINYSVAIANNTFVDAAGNLFAGGGIPTGGWDFTSAAVTGQDFTLTTGVDIFPGDLENGGNDVLRGVAGQPVGQQDQTTLNSSDVLDGGAGSDSLVLILNGNYGGGATIKNIETLQIGSNTQPAGGVTFDYNVNQGVFEVTGTNTILIDQITNGEILNVANLVPTAVTNVTPTLSWENEAGSRAGTFGVTYRQSAISGTADNQSVVLKNVTANNDDLTTARLNIAGGMETITIESTGSVPNNTLNRSDNVDTGNNAVWADVVSANSLTKVVLKGGAAIGKVGEVTGGGLTDRAIPTPNNVTPLDDDDRGLTAGATAANLLSVGSRVTEVDASAMTAAANVRFVGRADSSSVNVTFKGGAGNDYVEFELGNINATGNAGDDTFAYVNAGANSTFGEADTVNGGAGTDTLQLGLNGNAQTYNIGQTELSNVSSVEVIDLRGQTSNLTLSSGVVSRSDTANTITVRTDKIIQSSATDPANPVNGPNNALENQATATVNLTQLSSGQGATFLGGSGSDRLILNDATFNVNQSLDGGVYNDTALIPALSDRYDTITVVTNGENVVIDGNDLSRVRNFEGFVLTKNAAAATYNLTITQAFLTANTQVSNNPNTAINDTIFQIGTSNAANNSALAAGDIVNIDIRNLLNATDTGLAAPIGRFLDVTALENAGATVTFIGNTGNLTLAQARATGAVVANGVDPNFADVTTLSAANPGAAAGAILTFIGDSGDTTSGFEIQGGLAATSLADTINVQGRVLTAAAVLNGSAGVDTLVATTGANISAAGAGTVTSIEALNLTGAITMTQGQHTGILTAAGSLGIIAPGAADVVNMAVSSTLVGGTDADVETYNFTAGFFSGNVTGASTGAGGQTFIMGNQFSNVDTLTGGAGTADVMQTDVSFITAFTDIDNVSGIETIQLTQAAGTYAWTPTDASIFDADATVVTFNATALTTGTLALDLTNVDDRGLVVNLGLANAGVDVIIVDTTVANIANAHQVSGISTGDTINAAGAGGGTTYTVDLAAFNAATFVGEVNLALAANAAYLAAANDLILVRIGGLDTNIYAVEDITGDGVESTDAVVRLVGAQDIPIDGTVIV